MINCICSQAGDNSFDGLRRIRDVYRGEIDTRRNIRVRGVSKSDRAKALGVGPEDGRGLGGVASGNDRSRDGSGADAVSKDNGIVFQPAIIGLDRSRGVHMLAGGGEEIVVIAHEEEVVVRVDGIVGRNHGEGFPFFAQGVHIAMTTIEVESEFFRIGNAQIEFPQEVKSFCPSDRLDVGSEDSSRGDGVSFCIVVAINVGRIGQVRQQNGFEGRGVGVQDPATIAIPCEDEELSIANSNDGTLGAVAVDGRSVSGAASVIGPGKLDHILRDGIRRGIGCGDIINEHAGVGAALIACSRVLNSCALEQGEEAGAIRGLSDSFHALVDAATVQGRVEEEVIGADGSMGDEGGREPELTVELLGGVEVVDVGTVFVTDPPGTGFACAGVKDQALSVES